MTKLKFLSPDQVRSIVHTYGSPVYVYSEAKLRRSAQEALDFPNAYGLRVRYAMKANSTAAILSLFDSMGIHFDASSSFEVHRLLMNGIAPSHIQLTAQELAPDLKALIEKGVLFNACSLRQLETFGKLFPGQSLSVRINPGIGSGHANRVNVGGPASSFGIWHEHFEDIKVLAKKYDLTINALHTHIGSGSDPAVWEKVTKMNLDVVKVFPDVTTLNMGGGFKISRLKHEKTTDLQVIGSRVKTYFEDFYKETGRKIKLQIEPGTYLVAANGALIAEIDDKVDTGKDGYTFLKTNTGMSDFMRPTMYGVQHVMNLVPHEGNISNETENVVVVGHACESGDILTPTLGDSEGVDTILLPKVQIGDYLIIEDAGAYCSSMSAINYNSFPRVSEVLIKGNGDFVLIRKRQTMEQMIENEVLV
ncbi:MAG: diaminopimelate decarboxylase [Candidatus Marinimicrobia bacterium]|nr:diaminopimelate decarboxylase [Candidatus Neomarinimicrobiota bacterium]